MLEIRGIDVHYDSLRALSDVSLKVDKGEIVALVGANGAGKTTLVNAISGIVPLSKGEIWFEGKRIDQLPPEKIVSLGIVQVAEGRQLFPGLSIEENLQMGAYTVGDRKRVKSNIDRVFAMFPILKERKALAAMTLSGGQQQMLAIGRALMSDPRLVICDEPSLGLAPLIIRQIFNSLLDLHAAGTPILLIEQNVKLSLEVSSHAAVLEQGAVVLRGSSRELMTNPHIAKAYLGI